MQPDVTLARIERELTLLVRRAQKVRLDSGVSVEPMEGAAYAVLVVLSDEGPLRGGELAGRLHVDASTVSRQVASLVHGGFIEREADPEDGRACRLQVTMRGAEALTAAREARRRAVRGLLEAWSEKDRAAFASLLEKFNAGWDAQLLRFGLLERGGPTTPLVPPRSPRDAGTPLARKDGIGR